MFQNIHVYDIYVCSSYKPGEQSWTRKGPRPPYDKWNIYVVICDTYIP